MALTPEGTPYIESTDLVANYPAASLSLANRVDLVGVLPFADAAARSAAIPNPTDGQFTYLQDTNSTEFYNGSAFEAFGGGKILQVVRATDTTDRLTTSTTFVDVTGMSVTITPKKNTSAILIVATFMSDVLHSSSNSATGFTQITDSSNTAISGAQSAVQKITVTGGTAVLTQMPTTLIAYATPGTLSAVTYKLRFRIVSGTTRMQIYNTESTGQIYALEVGA